MHFMRDVITDRESGARPAFLPPDRALRARSAAALAGTL
jgi:hypothetical protein